MFVTRADATPRPVIYKSPMHILIVTDAWHPQINGVVRTLDITRGILERQGHRVTLFHPDLSRAATIPMPGYPEIHLELFAAPRLEALLKKEGRPDFIHIATEGPLGWTARRLCLRRGWPFTTSFHTSFPDYLAARLPPVIAHLGSFIAYRIMRRFHAPASAMMVATGSVAEKLKKKKFRNIVRWSRGVDLDLYKPYGKDFAPFQNLARPVLLNVGRVAVEKNLDDFLSLDLPGTKVVIGGGPDMERLRARYPDAVFLGPQTGETLARHYAAADLFVFPSTTDTFGLVLLEATACGLRIAARPSPGPVDIFESPESRDFAVLNADMGTAIRQALALSENPAASRAYAKRFSWETCTAQFYGHLQAPTPKAVKRLARLKRWLRGG